MTDRKKHDPWKPIEVAPKDRPIWARDPDRSYESKVKWNGHEWECIDWKGQMMGIGFYPKFWTELPARRSRDEKGAT